MILVFTFFLVNLENLNIYTNILIIKPDSNQCVLQGGQSDVITCLKALSEVLNNYLDIINGLENFTMASVNCSE